VKLGARLTEIGTLETWCESKISENRWRLQFELAQSGSGSHRAQARGRDRRTSAEGCAGVDPRCLFALAKSPIAPEELPAKLEQILGLGKNSWPLAAIANWPTLPHRGRWSQEKPRLRSALAESRRLLPAPRIRLSGRRLSHRAGAAHLFRRRPIRQPGTV
jgi:hypothetical protein